jgi:hypothetical protein
MLRPKSPRRGEMIEFLAQMPTDTMIFLTMAVLGFAAMLIGATYVNECAHFILAANSWETPP